MARQARDKITYGTYYIHQHGGGNRSLFENEADRLKFISILKKTKKKFNYKLYAFCLKNPDAYHLILYDNGGDISKIMKSINISYAMYAKCDGPLFKDRYKSTRLVYKEDILNITNTLRENAGTSQWNGYCSSNSDSDDVYDLLDQERFDNLETCPRGTPCIECVDDARKKLIQICEENYLTFDEMLQDKALRNSMIRRIRQNSTLSLKTLGELFGGLSESTICKILNES